MRTTLFLLLILLNGCATTQKLQQGEGVECDYFSIIWNTSTWDFASSKEEHFVKLIPFNWSGGYTEGQGFIIRIYKYVFYEGHKLREEIANINISSSSYQKRYEYISENDAEVFFDSDANYEILPRNSDGVPKLMTINQYGTAVYNKKWEKISYINSIKCLDTVYMGRTSKHYKIICGYYDKDKGKRILKITFDYDGFIRKNYDWEKISKTGDIPHIQPVERLLKQAVKQLIGTIKIKNLDRERMEREGLMHYDKRYELSKF